MRDTLIHHLGDVLRCASWNCALINGKWVPSRPLGFSSFRYRCKAAWLVFTGKADALIWPEGQ